MKSPVNSYNNEIAKINQAKYAIPPSWNLVQEWLDRFKMKQYHFERFFGVPFNTMTQVKSGARILPQYLWHIIYEKIKPRYGVGFVIETQKMKELNERVKMSRKSKLKKSSTTKEVSVDSHSRLLDIK